MNPNYVARALCFHGQPMQKIWENERGADDLQKLNLTQLNYNIYQERQKHFTFQDRAKRLKLHQFFSRKAIDLYNKELVGGVPDDELLKQIEENVAVVPPFECFLNTAKDKTKCCQYMLSGIKPGELVYAVILRRQSAGRLVVKPLCTGEPLVRYLADMPIKAFIPNEYVGPSPVDSQGNPRSFNVSEFVCCEVFNVSVDAERVTLGMTGALTKHKDKLGLVDSRDFPTYYRKTLGNENETFEHCLKEAIPFENPNLDVLFQFNGLNPNDNYSLMVPIKYNFLNSEYATELRQTQACKWAFRYVAEGIERFKIGHHVEAFQYLNKALNIDPNNVEGLVARGALYANKGSFVKAVEDFEKALNLNSYHVNARKYMGETLVALGHSYEEKNRMHDAAKAYHDCLNIIPNHEQARLSLEAIQQRPGGMQLYDTNNLPSIPGEMPSIENTTSIVSVSSSDDDGSSTDNSDTNDESSDGSDSSRQLKEGSLSPLNKRYKLHASSLKSSKSDKHVDDDGVQIKSSTDANEFKLEDDDTENRVRKLLQKASKHKKVKKKSKRKKPKKTKKPYKSTDPTELLKKINFEAAYKAIGGLHFENKLNENLQMYEKSIADLKKRQESTIPSQDSSMISFSMGKSLTRGGPQHAYKSQMINNNPFHSPDDNVPSTSKLQHQQKELERDSPPPPPPKIEPQKFSFQIRKPTKVDKFGLIRVATPLGMHRSETRSRSTSPRPKVLASTRREYSPFGSRSRSRSYDSRYSRHRRRYRRSQSRKRSYSRNRDRRRRSRSRSRDSSLDRSRESRYSNRREYNTSRYHGRGRGTGTGNGRRTPSPFVPRGTPSPRSRYRRSRSPDLKRRQNDHSSKNDLSKRGGSNRKNYGNRVWKRPDGTGGRNDGDADRDSTQSPTADQGQWLHDKYKEDEDEPSIEEVDEIINKAQKERKIEIINRDKDIVKKTSESKK